MNTNPSSHQKNELTKLIKLKKISPRVKDKNNKT
jgi:hypothetical protein